MSILLKICNGYLLIFLRPVELYAFVLLITVSVVVHEEECLWENFKHIFGLFYLK